VEGDVDFNELIGDEDLTVDEALRLGLSPLDLNDIDVLLSTDFVADSAAEQQLRLDQHMPTSTTSFHHRPF